MNGGSVDVVELSNTMTLIERIDSKITELLDEFSDTKGVNSSDLLKAKLILNLNNVSLALKLVRRLNDSFEMQLLIEAKILSPESINDMNIDELLNTSNLLQNRINDSYSKINFILGNLRLSELQDQLTSFTVTSITSEKDNTIPKELAIELIGELSKLN